METSKIVLENAYGYITKDEFYDLKKKLAQHNICLETVEVGPKASLDDIIILINGNIVELMLGGFMMPALYDSVKSSIKFIIYRIREKVKIYQVGRKVRDAIPCIELKTKNGEIKIPIPLNLPNEQFDRYMDEVHNAVQAIKPDLKKRYESFIIEQNSASLKVEVKTRLQYFQEQIARQEREQ